jgi:hypothetical protein
VDLKLKDREYLEHLAVLSLRILKTAANKKIAIEEKGRRIAKLGAKRDRLLQEYPGVPTDPSAANAARSAWIKLLGKLTRREIARQIGE